MLIKSILASSFFVIFTLNNLSFAQSENCNCKADLIFLDAKIKKTPAYKINRKAYAETYSKTLKKAVATNSIYPCYVLLNTLLLSINDNHSRIYGSDKGFLGDISIDSDKFNEFKNTLVFNAYPKPTMDIDSLTTALKSEPASHIEGIYHVDKSLCIGVYKSKKEVHYQAIVLDSKTDVWVKGEILYTLVPFGNKYLLNIGGGYASKRLTVFTERIENGFFYFSGFQKDTLKTNYSTILASDSTYYRKEISPDITYLRIGSFKAFYPILSDAESFYKKLEGTLNKKNLILDLRNNGGGGDRNSGILFKILKSYLKNNNVYVITNHRTASNAEQFTYRLSKFNNCKTFGHKTNGTLSYELVNSGYELPSGNFLAVLTSKAHSEYLELESIGIIPDVTLTMESDWIHQLVNYIEVNKK